MKNYVLWKIRRAGAYVTLFVGRRFIAFGVFLCKLGVCPKWYVRLTGTVVNKATDLTITSHEAFEALRASL